MIKLLDLLERSKQFWFLLSICLLFFILRLPSVMEPYWYGDEGIYQVIGQAIHSGRILYLEIWDNKPPLLYLLYSLFNGNQISIRFVSLFVGILSTISIFYLAKRLFKQPIPSMITTTFFALLFATPLFEGNIANAENFMLLPIITAGLLIYNLSIDHRNIKLKNLTIFTAGFLLGIAFLIKIVALFDLTAFFLFLLLINLPTKLSIKEFRILRKKILPIFIFGLFGFLLPLAITLIYFIYHQALNDFIRATFLGNISYVSYANKFFNIPQGLLILKLLILTSIVFVLFLKRQNISKATLFIILWFAFALFSTLFSQRPYIHYVLMLLPSFSLLIGLIFTSNKKFNLSVIAIIFFSVILIINVFKIRAFPKAISYYQNSILFLTGQKSVYEYRSFFDKKTPRDYEIASFIKNFTKKSDTVFIWGDNAQIYAMSNKLPPNKYTVAYHILQNKQALQDTQNALNIIKPKYIIILSEAKPLPFYIPFYTMRFGLKGATIYEKIF